MKIAQYYEDNNLFITKTSWDQLLQDRDSVAFHGVVTAARETINRDGAFIIYSDITSDVERKCDRLSELDDELA
ncbi:hypothetical protein [Pseudomonas sp. TWRC1-2]|uniref:hypothetical protein n=1 Tax=Pseudomonas sp. TWRC1-2 TaxID=2804628 RepID=UPI003CF0B064